jgi:hypothetical protein
MLEDDTLWAEDLVVMLLVRNRVRARGNKRPLAHHQYMPGACRVLYQPLHHQCSLLGSSL